MKKLLSLATALMLGVSAMAEDYTLYYDAADGTTNKSMAAVTQLRKLTFENGNVVLTYKDGTTSSTAIADINRLFFATPEAVGIDEVKEETLSNAFKGIYDLTGRKLSVSKDNLPKGIYIVDGKKIIVE